jgi:hypothetical protein
MAEKPDLNEENGCEDRKLEDRNLTRGSGSESGFPKHLWIMGSISQGVRRGPKTEILDLPCGWPTPEQPLGRLGVDRPQGIE